jgi:hypothetical protein
LSAGAASVFGQIEQKGDRTLTGIQLACWGNCNTGLLNIICPSPILRDRMPIALLSLISLRRQSV